MKDKLENAVDVMILTLKAYSPYDTGQLANVGIRRSTEELDTVLVGGSPAYYAVYTNEPWISPRWGGKKNPNEAWISKAVDAATPMIKAIFDGRVTQAEVDAYLDEQQITFVKNNKQGGYYDI